MKNKLFTSALLFCKQVTKNILSSIVVLQLLALSSLSYGQADVNLTTQNSALCEQRTKQKIVPSRFDRLLAGLWNSPACKFSNMSLGFKALFLTAAPLTVFAQAGNCRETLRGTADCHKIYSTYALPDCMYYCGSKTLTLPATLASQSALRVDDVGGHLVTSCSGALQKKYDDNQHRIRTTESAISRINRELEKAIEELEKAKQETKDIYRQAEEAAASSAASCPEPLGYKKLLPLPGTASETCEDTVVTQTAQTCNYTTHCKDLNGNKQLNNISVHKNAPDCRLDGTSTLRQENCNGKLKPRQSWESDTQCQNELTAKRHGDEL